MCKGSDQRKTTWKLETGKKKKSSVAFRQRTCPRLPEMRFRDPCEDETFLHERSNYQVFILEWQNRSHSSLKEFAQRHTYLCQSMRSRILRSDLDKIKNIWPQLQYMWRKADTEHYHVITLRTFKQGNTKEFFFLNDRILWVKKHPNLWQQQMFIS